MTRGLTCGSRGGDRCTEASRCRSAPPALTKQRENLHRGGTTIAVVPERARDLPLTERRILVYGVTGSGKSTAATRIAAATGLPLHLVDELTWLPGWVPVDDDVQRERFAGIVASDEWVLDTAYAAWKDLVLQRCQLVVGLDYPRWLSLARLVRRTLIRLVDRLGRLSDTRMRQVCGALAVAVDCSG